MHPPPAAALPSDLHTLVGAVGRGQRGPTACHVGRPGGQHSRFAHDEADPPSLRADLVERAIDGLLETSGACAWVTRSGALQLADADAEWFSAARTGFARHGLVLPAFLVVCDRGWVDLVSGEQG